MAKGRSSCRRPRPTSPRLGTRSAEASASWRPGCHSSSRFRCSSRGPSMVAPPSTTPRRTCIGTTSSTFRFRRPAFPPRPRRKPAPWPWALRSRSASSACWPSRCSCKTGASSSTNSPRVRTTAGTRPSTPTRRRSSSSTSAPCAGCPWAARSPCNRRSCSTSWAISGRTAKRPTGPRSSRILRPSCTSTIKARRRRAARWATSP